MDAKTKIERNRRRQDLTRIYNGLGSFDHRLSPTHLTKLGIRRLLMTIDSSNGPQFFAAYKAPIQKPVSDTLTNYPTFPWSPFSNSLEIAFFLSEYFGHCVLPEEESNPPGVSYADWGNFNFGDLVDVTRGSSWQVKTTWYMPASGVPHMVVLMASEMADGDALFHGEIKTAISVMHGRLRKAPLRSNVVAPVLLFSAIGEHHLRVIEAYHDGEHLVMRTTPMFDLKDRDDELFIKLSRWCLGGASAKSTKL